MNKNELECLVYVKTHSVVVVTFPTVAKRRKLGHLSDGSPEKSENVAENAQTVVRLCLCRYIIYIH